MGQPRQLIYLNFWECKQLEYWLKDNFPQCVLTSLYDKWNEPEAEDWYAIDGEIPLDALCLMKLKYGNKLKG